MVQLKRQVVGPLLAVFALAAGSAAAGSLPSPTEQPILTISGKIGATNRGDTAQFDRGMLEALGMETVETSTPWHNGPVRFEGVPLDRLMKEVEATGRRVSVVALNDYARFGSRLVGDLCMVSAVGSVRDRLRAAIPELRGGRVTQREAAHGLAQLHDRHALRLRHNGCFSKRHWCRWSGSRSADGYRLGRHRCRRRFSRRGWLCLRGRVRRVWLAWARRAYFPGRAVSKTEPIGFAEHGVSGQTTPQLCRDLAGAQALSPELFEALDPLLGPGQARICHRRLQAESLNQTDRGWPARVMVCSY